MTGSLRKKASWLPAFFVGLAGFSAIVSIPFQALSDKLDATMVVDPGSISRVTDLVIGFILIYLSGQLLKNKRRAYQIALAGNGLLIAVELLFLRDATQMFIYMLSFAILYLNRRQYVVKSNNRDVMQAFKLVAVIVAASLIFTIVVVSLIDQRYFGAHFTTIQTITYTIRWLLGVPDPNLPVSDPDKILIFFLRIAFISSLLLIVISLFRPVNFVFATSKDDIERAREILQKYARSSEDFFKLWPEDKHYCFNGDSFVAYKVRNGTALVLDGPTGNPRHFKKLMVEFMQFCRVNGWQVAFVYADEATERSVIDFDMAPIFIGQEAVVDVAAFTEHEYRSKHFRYIKNKAERDGLSFAFWEAPLRKEQVAALKHVSDEWIACGKREYGFFMGYFDPVYIASSDCAVLLRGEKVIGYCNVIPTFVKGAASIDHMRSERGVSSVAMHYLLYHLLFVLKDRAYSSLNLGLVPLAGLEEHNKVYGKKVLSIVRNFGAFYYSSAGLEQFKNKFRPTWFPKYMFVRKDLLGLAKVGVALTNAASTKTADRARKIVMSFAVLASVFYASWPLAIFVNPKHAFTGMVSVLGMATQPWSIVFNLLDVLSALIIVGLAYYLIHLGLKGWWRRAMWCMVLSSAGKILAACTPLDQGFSFPTTMVDLMDIELTLVVHTIASFLDVVGFISALVMWLVWADKEKTRWQIVVGWALLLTSTLGMVAGIALDHVAPVMQRASIILFAVWLVVFVAHAYQAAFHAEERKRRV